jgi:hypothetical protein
MEWFCFCIPGYFVADVLHSCPHHKIADHAFLVHVLAHEATRSVCFWISCAVGEPVLQFLVPDSVLASAVSVPSSVWVFQRFKPAEIRLYTVVVHFTGARQFNPKLHVSTLRPYLVVSRLEGTRRIEYNFE